MSYTTNKFLNSDTTTGDITQLKQDVETLNAEVALLNSEFATVITNPYTPVAPLTELTVNSNVHCTDVQTGTYASVDAEIARTAYITKTTGVTTVTSDLDVVGTNMTFNTNPVITNPYTPVLPLTELTINSNVHCTDVQTGTYASVDAEIARTEYITKTTGVTTITSDLDVVGTNMTFNTNPVATVPMLANYLPLAGGTMAGTLNMNSNSITNNTEILALESKTQNIDAVATVLGNTQFNGTTTSTDRITGNNGITITAGSNDFISPVSIQNTANIYNLTGPQINHLNEVTNPIAVAGSSYTWTTSSVATNSLLIVQNENGRLVYSGGNSTIFYSDDVTTKTACTGTFSGTYVVGYQATNHWAAISYLTTTSALTSTDGITWTTQTAPTYLSTANAMLYFGGYFITGCTLAGSQIYTSADYGVTWIPQTCTRTPFNFAIGSDRIVFCGTNGFGYSLDGVTWVNSADTTYCRGICYNSNTKKFYALAFSTADLLVSTDGNTWTTYTGKGKTTINFLLYVPELNIFCFSYTGNPFQFWASYDPITYGFKSVAIVGGSNQDAFYSMIYKSSTDNFVTVSSIAIASICSASNSNYLVANTAVVSASTYTEAITSRTGDLTITGRTHINNRPAMTGGYSQVTASTVGNSAVESANVLIADYGTLTIPANVVTLGTCSQGVFYGVVSSINNAILTIRIKLTDGTPTTTVSTLTHQFSGVHTNTPFIIDIHYSRNGASSMSALTRLSYHDSVTNMTGAVAYNSLTPLNYATAITLSMTFQWDTANVGNTITLNTGVDNNIFLQF